MSRRRKTLTLIFLSLLSVSAMFYMLSARHASESQKAPIVRANDARIEVAPLRKEVRGREREIEVHTTHKALKVDDNAKKSHNNVVKSLEAKKATKPTLEKLEVKNKPKTPMEKKKKTKPRKLKLEELSEEEKSLIISKQCAAGVCLPRNQLSSPEEVKRHDDCLLEAYWYVKDQQLLNGKNMSLSKCSCKLHSSKPKYGRVALVSLPGSGNTWARGLLQQATDLCTSAMWCDPNLRATKFCGEGLHSGKTLVVKNHDATVRWRGLPLTKGQSENNKPEFDAVIFVHRDPYEAMVAEHNREVAHDLWVQAIKENRSIHSTSHSVHVQHFGPEFFGYNQAWAARINELTHRWEEMVTHLLVQNAAKRPVLLVHYEDLKRNSSHEVLRMVKFLGVGIPESVVMERLKDGFTSFYRNHTQTFEHYTDMQKLQINKAITRVASKQQTLPVRSYLRR